MFGEGRCQSQQVLGAATSIASCLLRRAVEVADAVICPENGGYRRLAD